MHQSIPAAPPPPPAPGGNCRAFARLVSPGGETLANLARPGGTPEKFVDVFKSMFS